MKKLFGVILGQDVFGETYHDPIDVIEAENEQEAWNKADARWTDKYTWVHDVFEIQKEDCINAGYRQKQVKNITMLRTVYSVETFYGELIFNDWNNLVA